MTEAAAVGVSQSPWCVDYILSFGSYLLTISTSTDFAEPPGTATSSAAAANDFDIMVNVDRLSFSVRSAVKVSRAFCRRKIGDGGEIR
jgi:hypothetical protein